MKTTKQTFKLLAIAVMLCVANFANAQTLTRSVILKPAGSANTATIDLSVSPTASWSLDFPDGSLAATGPFMKVSVASGNKAVSFGQVTLSSNGAAGDITGTLGVGNGGTGLASIAAGGILLGAGGTSAMTVLSPSATNGQVLTMVAGAPAWSSSVGGQNTTFNISNTGTAAQPATTNINAGAAQNGGVINIGTNGTGGTPVASTTNFAGTVNLTNATVSLTLPTNNVWTGVANVATPLAPTANAVFITAGSGGLVPQWATSLPIANGGTGSTTIGAAGTVAYSTGTATAYAGPGTTGQVLTSTGGGAPTFSSINSLITTLAGQYTVLAADQTNGFAVITPAAATGYVQTSKVIITYQSATAGPAQAISVYNNSATQFTVYSGAMTTGDKINYLIIN